MGSGGAHSGIAGVFLLVEWYTVSLGSYLLMFVRDVMEIPSEFQRQSSSIRFAYLTRNIRKWYFFENSVTGDNEAACVPEDVNAVIICRLSLVQRINYRNLEENGVGKERSVLEPYLLLTGCFGNKTRPRVSQIYVSSLFCVKVRNYIVI